MNIAKRTYQSFSSLGILLSAAMAHAQSQDPNQSFNDSLKQAEQMYQAQIQQAQQQLTAANSTMTQCKADFQVGPDDKAHPNLDPVPDSSQAMAGMMQGLMPAAMQLGPSLPIILDNMKGAESTAYITGTAAIKSYDSALELFSEKWGKETNQDPKAIFKSLGGGQMSLNPKQITLTKSSVRTRAMDVCNRIPISPANSPSSDNTLLFIQQQKQSSCLGQADTLVANSFDDMMNKLLVTNQTTQASAALSGAAITAATGGFMAYSQHNADVKQTTQDNQTKQQAADNGYAACKTGAQGQIDAASRALASAQTDRANGLRDLALRNAAALNSMTAPPVAVNGTGSALPPINPGNPDAVSAKNSAAATPANATADAGSPAPAASGSPAGGSSGGGTPTWGFGGGSNGNYLGGGLPAQEGGAQFAGSGGGSVYGGGFGQDGALSLDGTSTSSATGGVAQRGLASEGGGIGDGGLNVMLARMRLRFAYHATDLMQGTSLKSLTKKSESKAKESNSDPEPMTTSKF